MSTPSSLCPNCGAEIQFRWSGAVQTTCPACKSVLVRRDLNLERVGEIGDVPLSMSRIQLGSEGTYDGKAFTVVGRIVYRYARGHWSEWYIRFGNDESAWLSDAQGEYAVTRHVAADRLPDADLLSPGQALPVGTKVYYVASITEASYAGVEGELPFEYWDKSTMKFADLKSADGGFATLDYSEYPPIGFAGEYVSFDALRLRLLREPAFGETDSGIKASGLNCPQCGAAIELRLGTLAQTIACPACTAILDATDDNFRILAESQRKTRVAPAIPLGAIGEFKSVKWQNVGFRVVAITVDGVSYAWREYTLWNADQGFRYLTEYDGHWNDVVVVKGVPSTARRGGHQMADYLGTPFKHFQRAEAETRFVLGEFPWEVRVGDKVMGSDYIAPPLMLSSEETADEITWSLGTYTQPEQIQKAFRLKEDLPRPKGVFANQPSPYTGRGAAYTRAFTLLAILLAVVTVVRFVTASGKQVFTQGYEYAAPVLHQGDSAASNAFVTPEFDIPGHTSNVQIRIATGLENDWAYFNLALLRSDGGHGYELGREVSYYHGVDQGESWSEGSRNDRSMLASIPEGKYYLRVEIDRDAMAKPFAYRITVIRDVPRISPFVFALVFLALPPFLLFIRHAIFEQKRWHESDYATAEDD